MPSSDRIDLAGKAIGIVANPRAGAHRGSRAADEAARVFRDHGATVDIRLTEAGGHAAQLALELSASCAIVAAVGGDGTLAEVVAGLSRSDREPMAALIPMGTANVLAREFGLAIGAPRRAAEQIAGGRLVEIDQGFAGETPFLVNAGAGFDACVIANLADYRARRARAVGLLDYVPVGMAVLRRYRTPRIWMTIEGGRREGPYSSVVVCNTRNYGGVFSVTPKARPGDGHFDVAARSGSGRRHVLRHLAAALLRCEDRRRVDHRVATALRLESDQPEAFQIDGNPAGQLPVDITMAANPRQMIAPASYREGER